ncbi:MAG: hypothetical protein QXT67_04825 [Candidatus Bathyarchaeia archaeon]
MPRVNITRIKSLIRKQRTTSWFFISALIALFGILGMPKATLLIVGGYFIIEGIIADTKELSLIYMLSGLLIILGFFM